MTQDVEAPVAVAPANIDTIVDRYVKLRDRKSVLKKAYDVSVEDIDVALTKLENFLLKHLQTVGGESIKTAHGTAYVTTKTGATISDWDRYRDFILSQEDPFIFIDRKANKTAVEVYSKEHGDVPPGINWTAIKAVNVRRA